ncbi:MAG: GGDEF domain-containing protein [Thiobacillus sp.]
MAELQNTPPRRLISLRQRFFWLLIGVVGLFVAGMTLSLVFSLHSDDAAEMRLLNMEAAQTHSGVMRRWDYYQGFVDNLARDALLIELMRSGSDKDRQQWASSRQHWVPNLVGLTLISLRGAPNQQSDRRQREPGPGPVPVQHDRTGQAYVDLTADVHDSDGAVLGHLSASVQLTQLQRIIDDSTLPGHTITLFDGADKPVVSSGTLQGAVREISVSLPTMGWRLLVQSSIPHLGRGGWLQILAGILTLVGVLALLMVVVLRMRRPVLQDIDAALDALACLTRDESAPLIATRYVEFAPAALAINRIAQQLHDQREQLATLSLTDALTGLPNRRAFEAQFPHMLGLADRGHVIALVLLDVDHFKAINDQFGHAGGDQALIALANTLKALTRSSDMTARLAGDEFTALLSGLDNDGVQAWYQRLADRFRSELQAKGLALDNTISAGHTWLQSMAGDSIGKALARADDALYQAKARGRAQLVLSDGVREKGSG